MFISRYLMIGLAYTAFVLTVYLISEGSDYVGKTFFDWTGWIVLAINTVAWPIMLGLSIWTYLKGTET